MHKDLILYILLAAVLILSALLLFILITTRKELSALIKKDELLKRMEGISGDMSILKRDMNETIPRQVGEIRQDIDRRLSQDADENRRNRMEISEYLQNSQDRLQQTLKASLYDLSESNRQKLNEIQGEINKKLDTSLNERLERSFNTVGEQLNRLYTSLGELSKLESDVTNLNRTLSNVKTRGIYGEAQLENILADILPTNLYDKNVITKRSSSANKEAVEFAVKIPDKESVGEFLYLPIDSKFPGNIYERIRECAENADSQGLVAATKELDQFIKKEAKSIADKYIDPPYTTDFALMFLPTESLYAEVLRIPGLSDEVRQKQHIVITGPSTLSALLSSLNIGFRYMAVNRDSKNILKLLSAIKTQYSTLSKLINTASNRIELAGRATQDLQKRADMINKKLSRVEELEPSEAKKLLGMDPLPEEEDEADGGSLIP